MSLSKTVLMSIRPIGAGAWGPASGLGANWIICDHTRYDKAQYPLLAGIIGNKYSIGGDNLTTTFRVPPASGRVLVSLDNYGTSTGAASRHTAGTANTLGATGGTAAHTLLVAEIPNHYHNTGESAHGHSTTHPGHTHAGHTRHAGTVYIASTATGTQRYFASVVDGGRDDNPGRSSTVDILDQFPGSTSGYTVGAAGSGTAHENQQPYLDEVLYIRAW